MPVDVRFEQLLQATIVKRDALNRLIRTLEHAIAIGACEMSEDPGSQGFAAVPQEPGASAGETGS